MNRSTGEISLAERCTLAALAALSVVLRAVAYFRYRFDSDEPQHLHVAWGWTAGMVQYRDYFDNHAPLFHILSAPLLKALGERPDILLYMRAPMLVLFAIVMAATWMVARHYYSRRVALWSVLLLSLFPPFFLKTLEYRTDNLWNAVWAVALVVVTAIWLEAGTNKAEAAAAALLCGFVLGIGVCVSLKTVLLVASLVLAALGTRFALRERLLRGGDAVPALLFTAAFVIPPAALIGYFRALNAWDNMLYCVVRFNELVEATHGHVLLARLIYPLAMVLVLSYARRVGADADPGSRGRFYLGMLTAMFFITLAGFWVLISPRDYLPMMPLLAILTASYLTRRDWPRVAQLSVLSGLAALFLLMIAHYTDRFANHTDEHITMMNQVLRLTRPGEPLMDFKGETIYRRRPFYYVFELITRQAMYRGLITDTVAESVVSTSCHVVQADGEFWPPGARRFLSANFVDVGRLRAAGQWLHNGAFTIAVRGQYVMIDKAGPASGWLDGSPYVGARFLEPGAHRFVGASAERVVCLWAPAFQRGFSPFHLKDRDF